MSCIINISETGFLHFKHKAHRLVHFSSLADKKEVEKLEGKTLLSL